jgi:putative restriction endonuclease
LDTRDQYTSTSFVFFSMLYLFRLFNSENGISLHNRHDYRLITMAKGVFIVRPGSEYDDLPEVRCQFPHTYLGKAKETVGDWILYYEPRRNHGRQAYFATAYVTHIEPDPINKKLYYAYVQEYLEFAQSVPFREGNIYYESALLLQNGSVNLGLFQRAIHLLPDKEYITILNRGMAPIIMDKESMQEKVEYSEEPPDHIERAKTEQIVKRAERDRAFRINVRSAYDSTCAMTGLRLINGGGHCEIEAAHIRPVENDGPDSTRNGLALSRTIHWLFDRGVISLEDDGRILTTAKLIPERIRPMLNADGYARFPKSTLLRPHPQFLRYHRENKFVG